MANVAESRARLNEHVSETAVSLSAQFRQLEMTAHDIVQLRVGDLVPLSHPLDEPLMLMVGDTATHRARIGRRHRRLAVVIDSQADPSEYRQPVKVTLSGPQSRPA